MTPEDYEVMKVKVTDVEDYMPSREVKDFLGKDHLLYLEKDVSDTDRCMCLSNGDKDTPEIHLFKITPEMGNDQEHLKSVYEKSDFKDEETQILVKKLEAQGNLAKIYLSQLDLNNDIIAKNLLTKAKDILDAVKGKSEKQLDLKDFSRTIYVGDRNFTIKFMPSLWGGIKLKEEYKKKVMKRIEKGAS